MTTYATVQQLRKAYDSRLLADLGGDGNTPGSVTESNSILTTALNRASADVRSYAMRGGRYSETDLDTLYGDDDWTLIGLCCDLAIGRLSARRGGSMAIDLKDAVKNADTMLRALEEGENIFNVPAAVAAGLPTVSVIRAGARGQLNLLSDSPYFPTRRSDSEVSG